jgi:hypothetical protein
MANNDKHLKEVLCDKITMAEDRRMLQMVLFIVENWDDKNYIEKMSLAELRQLLS